MKHPLTLASTLGFFSMLHHFRREVAAAADKAAEAVACTREDALTYWFGFTNALHGWAVAQVADSTGAPSRWTKVLGEIRRASRGPS